MVEYAAGLTLFMLILMGVVDFGRAIWIRNTMAHAAREAARYGAAATRTSTEIRDYAIDRATGIGLTSSNVSVTRGTCGNVDAPVVVTITYSFSPITPLISSTWGGAAIAMGTSSSMYVEQGVPPCGA